MTRETSTVPDPGTLEAVFRVLRQKRVPFSVSFETSGKLKWKVFIDLQGRNQDRANCTSHTVELLQKAYGKHFTVGGSVFLEGEL